MLYLKMIVRKIVISFCNNIRHFSNEKQKFDKQFAFQVLWSSWLPCAEQEYHSFSSGISVSINVGAVAVKEEMHLQNKSL